jgi:hypothetical protein
MPNLPAVPSNQHGTGPTTCNLCRPKGPHTCPLTMYDLAVMQVQHPLCHINEQAQQQVQQGLPGLLLVQQPRPQGLTQGGLAPLLNKEPAQ